MQKRCSKSGAVDRQFQFPGLPEWPTRRSLIDKIAAGAEIGQPLSHWIIAGCVSGVTGCSRVRRTGDGMCAQPRDIIAVCVPSTATGRTTLGGISGRCTAGSTLPGTVLLRTRLPSTMWEPLIRPGGEQQRSPGISVSGDTAPGHQGRIPFRELMRTSFRLALTGMPEQPPPSDNRSS